jgi:hypothetical protein
VHEGGKYDDCGKDLTVHISRQRRNTSIIKTDCKYQVQAKKCEDQSGYLVKVLKNNDNHSPVTAISALPQHRSATTKDIEDMQDAEADEEAHSRAVETLIATKARNRAKRKRKASSKAIDNTELEAIKKGKRAGCGD